MTRHLLDELAGAVGGIGMGILLLVIAAWFVRVGSVIL